jgi:hypothetical protein
MQSFIGCKIVQAEPMDNCTFAQSKGKPWDTDYKVEPGYKVIYPDGYESWSPKAVFEQAYRLISDAEAELVQYENECEPETNLGI